MYGVFLLKNTLYAAFFTEETYNNNIHFNKKPYF